MTWQVLNDVDIIINCAGNVDFEVLPRKLTTCDVHLVATDYN